MNLEQLKQLANEQATNPVILGIIAHLESKEVPVVKAKKVTKKVK